MATLITGGTGFVGRQLISQMTDDVIITSRNAEGALARLGDSIKHAISWLPTSEALDLDPKTPINAVVNLMGDSIADGRWNAAKKKKIRESRVVGTNRLVDAILKLDRPPSVFVSASAVGYYGDCGDDIVQEDYRRGDGFLPEICEEWEIAARRLEQHDVRVCLLRIGLVMGQDGGALEKMIPLFKWGLGGKLGSGQQFMPWIHVEDLCRMIVWAIENPGISGPLNGTAPNPVRNSDFTRQLGQRLKRFTLLPAPKFGLRMVLGEFANSLFSSQNVVPAVALENGFQFNYASLEQALTDIIPE